VGDGGNDVLMLEQAGVGIAFMAKPVARAAADVVVDVPDLREVLTVLGIRA
jgi:phosphoserine phosphatase